MASDNNVKSTPFVFGTAGTSTLVAAGGTSTSMPFPLPRNDFTVTVTVVGGLTTTTASSTASSTANAIIAMQVSNDTVAWFGISSATANIVQTTTSTGTVQTLSTGAAAGTNSAGQRYAYGRCVVSVTGTGSAFPQIAF
jgi:hypothetical protein